MENIETILEGIELTDEIRNQIIEGVKANYKTIAELEGKANRITELESELQKRDETISGLQGNQSEIEELRQQVADFQAKDQKRLEDEQRKAKQTEFEGKFNSAVGEIGKEFVNAYTRDAVLQSVREQCESTDGLGIKEAIETVAKTDPTIWKNPQREVFNMPNDIDSGADIAIKKKDMASRIFGSSLLSDKE